MVERITGKGSQVRIIAARRARIEAFGRLQQAHPDWSDTQYAEALGTHKSTVSGYRTALQNRAERAATTLTPHEQLIMETINDFPNLTTTEVMKIVDALERQNRED